MKLSNVMGRTDRTLEGCTIDRQLPANLHRALRPAPFRHTIDAMLRQHSSVEHSGLGGWRNLHGIARRIFSFLAFLSVFAIAPGVVVAGITIIGDDGQLINLPSVSESGSDKARITKPPPPRVKRALVVGIKDYTNAVDVTNAVRDAELISSSLETLGFGVVTILNPDLAELTRAIEDHASTLAGSPGDAEVVSVFYYAGHGARVGELNYMAASDIVTGDIDEFRNGTLSVEKVADKLRESMLAFTGANSVLFFDASRSNPFSNNTDAIPEAEKQIWSPKLGTAIVYATLPGAEALDGDGENSPFATSISRLMLEPNLHFDEFARRLRVDVITATTGNQVTSEISALDIQPPLYFNLVPEAVLPEEPPETRAAKVIYRKADGELEPTYADGSFALLIGVGDYRETAAGQQAWNDLANVTDELTRLGSVLEQVHGFEVNTVFDPTGDELEAALESFVNLHGPKPDARLLIMMSGHGTTTEKYGRKTAWFVPADAPATEPPAPFLNTALNLRRVEEWSEIMAAKHVMWIFDSCFSGAAIRMIERKSGGAPDGWAEHLHQNPVRRVLTAGSENEEVPAKSRFTEMLIRVLAGQETVEGAGDYITGQQLGAFLKQDIIRYNFRQGLPKNTPQSDTIVIPVEEGDVVFSIDPELSARWASTAD